MLYLVTFLYYSIPIGALLFFFVSLFRFLSARQKNQKQPGSVDDVRMKLLKQMLITSSVIVGLLIAVVVGFILLLMTAVTFM